jgi:hypothetical protein
MLPHHALQANRVKFKWREKEHEFEAKPEKWFTEFLNRLL